jgi:hypothetical protein
VTHFELDLKNDKRRYYDRIALIFVVVNLLVFIYLILNVDSNTTRAAAGFGILLSTYSVIQLYFGRSFTIVPDKHFRFWAIVSVMIPWMYLGKWWIVGLIAMVLFTYIIARRPLKVKVGEGVISYPSFPAKKISWAELNNIILKDDLLTIDFKNNRIIQQMIDKKFRSVKEEDFNEFCREQLKQVQLA